MKFNLSPSSMNVYFESQLMYYFQKVIKAQLSDWVPQCYGALGNCLHSTLEEVDKLNKDQLESLFWEKYYGSAAAKSVGIRGTYPDPYKYSEAVRYGKEIFELKYDIISCEEIITIPIYVNNEHTIYLKGIIDVQAKLKKDGSYVIVDHKSSTSIDKGDNFKRQGLFYSMLIYRVKGILPTQVIFEYEKIKKTKSFSFTIKELDDFYDLCISTINDIIGKGTDIRQFEIGEINSIFNGHKTLCEQVKESRKNKLNFGIAIYGNTSILVGDITDILKNKLDKLMSYEKENAEFIKQNSDWDGIVHLYNKYKNTFPTGYIPLVKKILKHYSEYMKKDYRLEMKDMRKQTKKITYCEKLEGIKFRSYQEESSIAFFKAQYGIIKLKTGLGKTIAAGEIIRKAGLVTLWVIDRKLLVEQTAKTYQELFNEEIGTITEGKIDIKNITICTYQTLNRRFKELAEYLKTVGFLVVDECHKASAMSIKNIAERCTNTKYRLGLSATPDLKNEWPEVKGILGDICYQLDKDDPRNKEFLAEADINFISLDDRKFADSGDYRESYNSYIVHNDIRNNCIKKLVDKHKNENILIVTKLIEHAKILSKLLNCAIIIGETSTEERNRITEEYAKEKPFICVGSVQIISEGWDVPTLSVLIQASAMSSNIKTIQGLGRPLRKNNNKDKAIYYDFLDKYNKYTNDASKNRIKALKYEGNILKVING